MAANPFDEFDEPKKEVNPFDEFDAAKAPKATAPASITPPPEPSFGEQAARKVYAGALGITKAIPFSEQAIAALRTLKGPETFKEELATLRREKAGAAKLEPWTTGLSQAGMTLATLPLIAGKAASIPTLAARFGTYGAAEEAGREGSTVGSTLAAGATSAAVPALFKKANLAAKALTPAASSSALRAAGLRTGQALIKAAPVAAVAEAPISTLASGDTTEAEKVEAGATLAAMLGLPIAQAYKGAKRVGAERAGSIAEQAAMEAQRVIGEKQAKRGEEAISQVRTSEAKAEASRAKAAEQAISQVRTGEAKTEVSRAKAAEQAIAEARKAESAAYEADVKRETGREVQSAKAKTDEATLLGRQQAEETVRQERRAQQDALEQQTDQLRDRARQSKMAAEDQALTDAQQRFDVASEAKIWEQKNRRAQRAVKDEQRIMSSAERLRSGDQAAITELQNDIARLKRAEDAIAAGDDPSLRGAIAKEYQDMRHRLETAIGFFRDGGVEPPPEYQQAYDAVRESYLRNTKSQGYTGFGTPDELFLEDPRAWAERKKQRMLQKTEVERTGKEADLVDFLDSIAARDYMAEARATRAGPRVPDARLQEIFADQGLEYNGGPLIGPDGVPLKQAFVGGRTPNAPFTSPETMAQSIARRRQLQTEQEATTRLLRDLRRAQPRVSSVGERQRTARIAELQAQQTTGFSGLTPRQEIEQAVRARMPVPAGMTEADILSRAGVSPTAASPLTEADILSRAGVSPTPALPFAEADILRAAGVTPAEAARLLAEQRAAARANVEFGTPTPTPATQRQLDLSSTGRALYETVFPAAIRPSILLRGGSGGLRGANIVPRTLPAATARSTPTMSTEARMRTPFEALELASAFQRVLETDSAFAQGFRRFLNTAPNATWAAYLRTDPIARAKIEAAREAEREAAAP